MAEIASATMPAGEMPKPRRQKKVFKPPSDADVCKVKVRSPVYISGRAFENLERTRSTRGRGDVARRRWSSSAGYRRLTPLAAARRQSHLSSVVSAQVSIARRLVKEVAHYEAETKKDEARVEAMRADPTKDEYDVKKMLEVVEESRMMIPDATRRLGEAINELFSFIEEHHATTEVLECESYAEATALLEKYDDMVTD